MNKLTEKEIIEWVKPVQDPELFMGLVDLGLVYGADIDEGGKVTLRMTLTSPACPAAETLPAEMKQRLLEHQDIESAEVKIVWEPKWDPKEMASEEAKEALGIW